MKKLGIKIVILSRGRWDSISTTKLLPDWIEVVVPESQAEKYAAEIDNPLITTPDSVVGLGMLRNWCLKNFSEESVIMVDDDINHFYRLTGERTEAVTDELEFVQILINTCVMSRDLGAKVFGFFQTDIRKFRGYDPFSLCCWVGTIIGVNDRKYEFRNDKFKVDIDFCLQNLLVERVVWCDNRYYASNYKDMNTGGNAEFRSETEYNKSLESLCEKWGDCLKVRKYKNQNRVSLNISRKQAIKL